MFTSLKKLFSHVSARRRWQLVGLMFLMVVGATAEVATLGAVVPFLALLADPDWANRYPALQEFMSRLSIQPEQMLPFAAALFALIALTASGVRLLLYWVTYRFTFGLGADISSKLYRRTLDRPYSWHVSRNSSEIVAAIEKVNTVTNQVIVQLVQGTVALLIGAAIMVTLLIIDTRTALLAGVVFSVFYGVISITSRRRLHRNSKIVAKNRTGRVQSVQEGLGGIRDVILDGMHAIYQRRFAVVDAEMRRAQATNAFISASPRVLLEAVGVVLIMLLAYGMSGQPGGLPAAIPILGALALGAQKLLPQMQLVYHAWSAITGNRAEMDDVLNLLEESVEPDSRESSVESSQATPVPNSDGTMIVLRDVSFQYRPDSPHVLQSINLEIPKGMRVGIVGTTGCGKSTLMDILMGLLTPTAGSVEIDGTKLTPRNLETWQSRIAHVPQAIYLADASIAENIAFGISSEKIDRDSLTEAISQSQLSEFISSLPEGYRTQVGERGVRLSGGQRQRIGLARALYKKTDVLVLDEATSALDGPTEDAVMKALDESTQDRTTFIIAHRLSTVRSCDRILILEDGEAIGFDTWEALEANSSVFRHITKTRRDGSENVSDLSGPKSNETELLYKQQRSKENA